jgi:signal transduction histidine kinase
MPITIFDSDTIPRSGSPTARVDIHRSPTGITMEIQDEGKGIQNVTLKRDSKPAATMGVGLAGMRERVRQLGGQLEVRSTGRGTTLKVVLPLN